MRGRARDTRKRWCSFVTACTEASTQMPEPSSTSTITVTISVPTWVRKYALKRLSDFSLLQYDNGGGLLYAQIQRTLHPWRLMQLVNDWDANLDKPSSKVQLVLLPPDQELDHLPARKYRYLVALLTRSYIGDLMQWVSWYHTNLGLTKKKALESWLEHHGITEDDQSLESALRMIRRPRNPRRGRSVKRSSQLR